MMRRAGWFAVLACLAVGWAVSAKSGENSAPSSRDGVWRTIFARPPASEPVDAAGKARVQLGEALFRDTRLSGDGARSCASCHDPARAFTDGRPRALGRDGRDLQRNTPSIFNLAYSPHFFADGRVATLEDQARVPIAEPNELNGNLGAIAATLNADPGTALAFAAAFPSAPAASEANILLALAAFERTLISPPTRFDAWVAGDDKALSDSERRGFATFVGNGGCVGCHGGWRFTDDQFRDIGLPASDDIGRSAISGASPDLRQFKTPGLRELAHTAPYMHDGSLRTLKDVVDHYAGGFVKRPSVDSNLVGDLVLSDAEKADLVAFLGTLSSP